MFKFSHFPERNKTCNDFPKLLAPMPPAQTSATFPDAPSRLAATSKFPSPAPRASATEASFTPTRRAPLHQETSATEAADPEPTSVTEIDRSDPEASAADPLDHFLRSAAAVTVRAEDRSAVSEHFSVWGRPGAPTVRLSRLKKSSSSSIQLNLAVIWKVFYFV